MNKNTFWSHTAPSYELIDDDQGVDCINQCQKGLADTTSSISLNAKVGCEGDEVFIEIRVFHTASVDSLDRREKKFIFSKKNNTR